MNVLLDTHAFLWLDAASAKLSQRAREICENTNNILILSIASAWEMQIKSQLGKLKLNVPLPEMILLQRKTNRVRILPVTLSHVFGLGQLPPHHRDPFDRIIIAQAKAENLRILSNDSIMLKYTDRVIW